MRINKTEQRVFYSDTDHGGFVYYANYLRWFEVGRTELLREYGLDYADLEKRGIIVPVVEVHCNYRFPAKYNDTVSIQTRIDKIGNSSIKFHYNVSRKKDKKLLADGYTVNVFVDKKKMKSVKIPDDIIKKIKID